MNPSTPSGPPAVAVSGAPPAHSPLIPGLALSPETELLACCCRCMVGRDDHARIDELLGRNLDWSGFLHRAGVERIMPLAHETLVRRHADRVPPPALASLRRSYLANAAHNRFLTSELLRVLNLLDQIGVPAIPFKGPVLAETLYGGLELRQIGDLDILVRQQDVDAALALLQNDGYQRVVEDVDYHHELQHERNRVRLELHFGILPSHLALAPDPEAFWQRAQPTSFAGRSVLQLSAEDLLLYMCVHGIKHNWASLERIFGVAKLLEKRPDLNWALTLEQARAFGLERSLMLGLALARDLFDSVWPPAVAARMRRNRGIESLSRQALGWTFHKSGDRISLDEEYTLHLKIREGGWRRLLYLMHVLFHPTKKDRSAVPLPGPLAILYAPVRVVRVLCSADGRAGAARFFRGLISR